MTTRGRRTAASLRLPDEVAQHFFSRVEIGNDAVALGLIALMVPGVRPTMAFASLPTASMPVAQVVEGNDGGLVEHDPLAAGKDAVLAVPRSMARSFENMQRPQLT